ncbi:uncharacterized protein CEXT_547561 [Caerostris extrusa]|uniref:Uncharacterized protein n=1 Tax=Caerostris extrusa TaxID=172846 RepID=A0AAV4XIF2_CAEEX|nr:uncharacterized protein CEXT_547561 [Caerostris extrusa]
MGLLVHGYIDLNNYRYIKPWAKSELSDQETVVYPDQLESTSLALRFRLKPDVLHNGKVILKCVATINHIHAVTIKEIRATAFPSPPFSSSTLESNQKKERKGKKGKKKEKMVDSKIPLEKMEHSPASRFHLHHLVHPLWKAIRKEERKGKKGEKRGKNGWFKDSIGENETFTCIGARQFVKEPLNEQKAIFRSEIENYFSFDIIPNFSLECKLSIPARKRK